MFDRCLSICLSTGRYLPWPGPRYLRPPPPPQFLMWGTARYLPPLPPKVPTPWPGPSGEGVPQGAYPPPKVPTTWLDPDGGVPQGTYPPGQVRMGGRGYPKVPTARPRTCYTAGGIPLAFKQEDFLVLVHFHVKILVTTNLCN